MDEIAQETNYPEKHNTKYQLNVQILLWMDVIAMTTNNLNNMKQALKITEQIANRYRLEFGKE